MSNVRISRKKVLVPDGDLGRFGDAISAMTFFSTLHLTPALTLTPILNLTLNMTLTLTLPLPKNKRIADELPSPKRPIAETSHSSPWHILLIE